MSFNMSTNLIDPEMWAMLLSQTQQNQFAHDFRAFITPFIIIFGLCGNTISLCVFRSTRLRRLPASLYLVALSASDSVVLLTFVLLPWLKNGLYRWPGNYSMDLINYNISCQCFYLFSYTFRFISVYLIVVFTLERSIAVCQPLKRRVICTKAFARRVIISVCVVGFILGFCRLAFIGIYSTPHSSHDNTSVLIETFNISINDTTEDSQLYAPVCKANPLFKDHLFVFEIVYGVLITAVPLLIITVLNVVMLKKLINTQAPRNSFVSIFKRRKIRVEFTRMVIAVSLLFVILNVPYFIAWLIQRIRGSESAALAITRALFSVNYSINFIIYCLTGTYYRSILKRMFICSKNTDSMYNSRNAVELSLIPNQNSATKSTIKKDSKNSDSSDDVKDII